MLIGILDAPVNTKVIAEAPVSEFSVVRIEDDPVNQVAMATYRIGFTTYSRAVLWKGDDYAARPAYSDDDVVARVKEIIEAKPPVG